MPHMIFRSSFYYLYRSVMNTGGGSSRAAFQLDLFDMKDAWTHSAHSYQSANSILVERHSSFSTKFSTFLKLRPIGCFSVSDECELMKYGSRGDAHAKTTAPNFCRAVKRAGADLIATYAALEVAEPLKKQEV